MNNYRQSESVLTKICSWGINCINYDCEGQTCNRDTEEQRRLYCGSYKSLEQYGIESRCYKVWRLGRKKE